MSQKEIEHIVLETTRRFLIERTGDDPNALVVNLEDAVCQDLMIFGVDVDDYVWELEKKFGKVVWTIPWLHFTDQTGSHRGISACLIAPFLIPWVFFKRVVWGTSSLKIPHPKTHPHRLQLNDIAAAIDAGGWPQDWRPE